MAENIGCRRTEDWTGEKPATDIRVNLDLTQMRIMAWQGVFFG